MKHKNYNKYIKDLLVKILIIGISLSIFRLIGSTTRCIFKNISGIPCPACGMTRAFENLIKGNYQEAFYYHPLFFVVILIVILYIFKGIKPIDKLWISFRLWIFILILLIGVYLIRMKMYFPNEPPMNYYEENMLLKIYTKIK